MTEDSRPDLSRFSQEYKWSWMEFPGYPAIFSPKGRDELICVFLAIRSGLIQGALAAAFATAAVYGLEEMEWIRAAPDPAWLIPAISAAAGFLSRLAVLTARDVRQYLRGKRGFASEQVAMADAFLACGLKEEHICGTSISSLEDLSVFTANSDMPDKLRAELMCLQTAVRTHFRHNARAGYYILALISDALLVLQRHFREERPVGLPDESQSSRSSTPDQ